MTTYGSSAQVLGTKTNSTMSDIFLVLQAIGSWLGSCQAVPQMNRWLL
jgi:hypothetical protein